VINEIYYNGGRDFPSKDWIELFNPQEVSISLNGWTIRDEDAEHHYTFPTTAMLPAHGFLVVTADTLRSARVYPGLSSLLGNLGFDLSNGGESITLLDDAGMMVDSLTYDDNPPWPIEADGEGYALELINPELDNTMPQSWSASAVIGGTPGRSNSTATKVRMLPAQLPTEFVLQQNYPNPFNSRTTIRYSLPRSGSVRLTIYDLLGRQTAELVHQQQQPGVYEITWPAEAASGLYFYRLTLTHEQGEETAVRKMVLAR